MAWYNNSWAVFGQDDPESVTQYIDDIRVRKYVTNPATYGFGDEESSTALTILIHLYNLLRG